MVDPRRRRLAVSLVGLGVAFVAGPVTALSGSAAPLLGAALVGGVLQVLLGSLSYLLPVMIGGGPAAARARTARVDRAMSARLVLLNTSLVFCVLPSPSAVRVLCSTLVLVAVAWTGLALADASADADRPAPVPADSPPRPARTAAAVRCSRWPASCWPSSAASPTTPWPWVPPRSQPSRQRPASPPLDASPRSR